MRRKPGHLEAVKLDCFCSVSQNGVRDLIVGSD